MMVCGCGGLWSRGVCVGVDGGGSALGWVWVGVAVVVWVGVVWLVWVGVGGAVWCLGGSVGGGGWWWKSGLVGGLFLRA